MIQTGQTYRSVRPSPADPRGDHTRIKVIDAPHTVAGMYHYGKAVVVTLTGTGREVRRRNLEASQLHATATTRDGQLRRTGYVLEVGQ